MFRQLETRFNLTVSIHVNRPFAVCGEIELNFALASSRSDLKKPPVLHWSFFATAAAVSLRATPLCLFTDCVRVKPSRSKVALELIDLLCELWVVAHLGRQGDEF